MKTIDGDFIRSNVIAILLAEGKLSDETAEVDESLTINAGRFRIDSLALIRAFIAMEEALDIEFGDEALMQQQFATFGDVIDYVIAQVREQAP